MQSKEVIRIGVTGHRNISTELSAALEPVIKQAIENIILYHKNTFGNTAPVIFSSSVAEGADTIFANVVLKYFDSKLRIILPFEKEEYIKDFTSEAKKKEFENILDNSKVSEIKCLSSLNAGEREVLYLIAGKEIVENSDYIIAIWDEEKAKGIGGTGDVVEYAVTIKNEVLVINPFEKKLQIKGDYLPEIFNNNYKKILQQNLNKNPLENFFSFYDNLALSNQKKYAKIWKQCFNLGLFIALIFSIEIAFFHSEADVLMGLILNCAALLCILFISYLVYSEQKNSLHKNYLANRYIAERLRIGNIFFKSGYQQEKIENSVIYSTVADFDSLLPLVINNKLLQLCSYCNCSFNEKKDIATFLLNEQTNYHKDRIKKLHRNIRTNKSIAGKLFIVFIALLICDILNQIITITPFKDLPAFISEWILFLSLIVPAIIARFEAKKYLSEWEKLISHSKYMIDYFQKLVAKITVAAKDEELCNAMNMLNENMYFENLEWEMFMLTKNEILQ